MYINCNACHTNSDYFYFLKYDFWTLLCLLFPIINVAVCIVPLDPGPECVLPWHFAGDGPWHPVLLGRPYGDDGPQTDRQAALQRGENTTQQGGMLELVAGHDSGCGCFLPGVSACSGERRPREEDEQISGQRHWPSGRHYRNLPRGEASSSFRCKLTFILPSLQFGFSFTWSPHTHCSPWAYILVWFIKHSFLLPTSFYWGHKSLHHLGGKCSVSGSRSVL